MEDTYFIRIKKDYAAAVIEDLQKMDAVELITDDNFEIPDWQKEEVLEAVKYAEENPSTLMEWSEVKANIKRRIK
jgi:hypothetical protein